jgi:hypothetical protein
MREIEFYDLAAPLVPQFSADLRFDVLLVADAPQTYLNPNIGLPATRWSGPDG